MNPELHGLRAAVCAAPDDDIPRLLYADALDEAGDERGATFIRAQIALETLPEWDRDAANLRRRQQEWDLTAEWSPKLMRYHQWGGEWDQLRPFHRGFGHFLHANSVVPIAKTIPWVLEHEPVQRLALYTATHDEWKEFARNDWLLKIRELDFLRLGTPVEEIAELADATNASGIRALRFGSCTGAGFPTVLDRALRSPLGERLTTLQLSQGYGAEEYYFEDFRETFRVAGHNLESLHFVSMGFGAANLHELLTLRRWPKLTELNIRHEGGPAGIAYLGYADCWPLLHTVRFDGVNVNFGDRPTLAENLLPPKLRVLDLRNSLLSPDAVRSLAKAEHLSNLKILRLPRMRIDNRGLRYITEARFWKNLVELDLAGNPIDDAGAKHLLNRQPPSELEFLNLSGNFSDRMRQDLQSHFGERMLLLGE